MRPISTRKGISLPEVIVASFVLGLILVAAAAAYRAGAAGLSKTMAEGEMLAEAQVTAAKLSREIAASSFDSLTISGDERGASFLIRQDENGEFTFDPVDGRPLWQSYVLYYQSGGELKRRVVPLADGLDEAIPIEDWSGQTIDAYRSEGSTVARQIREARFESFSGRLRLTLTGERRRPGRTQPETFQLAFATMFRNRR